MKEALLLYHITGGKNRGTERLSVLPKTNRDKTGSPRSHVVKHLAASPSWALLVSLPRLSSHTSLYRRAPFCHSLLSISHQASGAFLGQRGELWAAQGPSRPAVCWEARSFVCWVWGERGLLSSHTEMWRQVSDLLWADPRGWEELWLHGGGWDSATLYPEVISHSVTTIYCMSSCNSWECLTWMSHILTSQSPIS